jgi:hypothetical protein
MPNKTTVIFKFDKTTDGFWLGMFEDPVKPQMKKEIGNIVILSLLVKEYSLSDHQFIQLKLDIRGSGVILLIPRNFVGCIVEGENVDKLGFQVP